MIVIELVGGLGNQMFIYAFGRALADAWKSSSKMYLNFYTQQNKRKYELGSFCIEDRFCCTLDVANLDKKRSLWEQLYRKLRYGNSSPVILEAGIEENLKLFKKRPHDVFLKGYWQNERYFKSIRQKLLSDFTLKHKLSEQAESIAGEIRQTNSVCLHVRRTDYVTEIETFISIGVCSLEYYEKGIAHMNAHVPDRHYFVFSDDIPWAKEHLPLQNNVSYISSAELPNAAENIHLMSLCQHHIIANSSFSWWGAWLNTDADQIVIAPKRWAKALDTTLALDTWLTM